MRSRSRMELEALISPPRLNRYLTLTNGDKTAALDLYEWNIDISGAFFESIGSLEIGLRNALHRELTVWCADETDPWYDDPKAVLNPGSKRAVQTARKRVRDASAQETPGRVVAQLTFGFWRFLLTGAYQQDLWVPALRHAFPGSKRDDVEDLVDELHQLRNRIAHHEAIVTRDLAADYDRLITVAELLNPRFAWWIDQRSRVLEVLRSRPT